MENSGCEDWISNVLVPGMLARNDFGLDQPESYEIDKVSVAVLPADGNWCGKT
jgi:hypothetical protein